jgi:hypothetical protein
MQDIFFYRKVYRSKHWRDWIPTVTEVKALNGTGLKVGANYRIVQPKLRPATYEVTEYVPNRRFR